MDHSKIIQKYDIRTIRLILGYARKDVSSHIGVSDKTLYKYEKEPGTTPLDVAKRLSRYYGIPLDQVDFN